MPARPAILIDSSFLIAFSYSRDRHHHTAIEADRLAVRRLHKIIILPVLYEVFYVLRERTTHSLALRAISAIVAASEILAPETEDLQHAFALLARYERAELDFTDATLMAVAERLNITRIATFDRRDFSLVQPEHAPYWTLLPKRI